MTLPALHNPRRSRWHTQARSCCPRSWRNPKDTLGISMRCWPRPMLSICHQDTTRSPTKHRFRWSPSTCQLDRTRSASGHCFQWSPSICRFRNRRRWSPPWRPQQQRTCRPRSRRRWSPQQQRTFRPRSWCRRSTLPPHRCPQNSLYILAEAVHILLSLQNEGNSLQLAELQTHSCPGHHCTKHFDPSPR